MSQFGCLLALCSYW